MGGLQQSLIRHKAVEIGWPPPRKRDPVHCHVIKGCDILTMKIEPRIVPR